MDWFLYDRDLRHKRVNRMQTCFLSKYCPKVSMWHCYRVCKKYKCSDFKNFKNLSFTDKKALRVNNTPMVRDTEKLRAAAPWAQDVNGTYKRRSEDL